MVWKVVGQHLVLNIIPNNFTARTRRKFWCDRGISLSLSQITALLILFTGDYLRRINNKPIEMKLVCWTDERYTYILSHTHTHRNPDFVYRRSFEKNQQQTYRIKLVCSMNERYTHTLSLSIFLITAIPTLFTWDHLRWSNNKPIGVKVVHWMDESWSDGLSPCMINGV